MNADFVVDNSALIEFFARDTPSEQLRRTMVTGNGTAPELVDAEALSVLRKMGKSGELSNEHARATLRAIVKAPIARAPHKSLVERAWELRHAIGAYDALYVALAEQLEVPLVTCDAKLAKSNGHHAQIEFYEKS